MDIFRSDNQGDNITQAAYLDMSAFDEKFEINLKTDYIGNIYHIENKYLVPVLVGGYREMYDYCRKYLIHPDDDDYAVMMDPNTLEERLKESGNISAQFRHKLVDGSYRWVQYVGIYGKQNGVPEDMAYFYIFDIQNQKDRIEGRSKGKQYGQNRDSLTGLRRREDFLPAVNEMISGSENCFCCIAIDIQHFKIFNTWFGYEKGDYLLSRIGAYLLELEKAGDAAVAYFGRDNFALCIPYNMNRIEKIYETIRGFIFEYSNTIGFLPAIGVLRLDRGAELSLESYDNARIAVEEAKKNYSNRICFYDSTDYEKTRQKFEFLTEFQNAMNNDEISFYLQPQCRITDGKIVGGEALARWIKADGTLISPGKFIPMLESYGFISELDKRVWEKVFLWIRSLMDRNITPLPVSINVSQIDLLSIDVADYLLSLSDFYGVPAEYVKVEITESAYAENYDVISDTITELKLKGFSVFLDDFGAGYSSLNMLDRINVDAIKLDMLFMKKEGKIGKKGLDIVESIFGLTKALELPVIIEGVENENQVRFLINLGFRYAQGYFFHKPLSISDYEELIQNPSVIDRSGLRVTTSDIIRAQELLKENMFTESTLNKILGAVAYYSLEGKNLTITRFNEPFRNAIGDSNMDSRIENIQNYVVEDDHGALYQALARAEESTVEGSKCEVRFYKSDGSIFWFRMQFYYLKSDGSRKLYFGQVEDITEQREQSLHFFDVLRKQSDVTLCIELDKNRIQYVTGERTLYQIDLPSMDLDSSIYMTAMNRIEKESDRKAFLEFFDNHRLKEAYRKAIYHEVLDVDFKLTDRSEPVEFSTYYIRHNRDESLVVYAFAKKRDREIMRLDPLTGLKNRYAYNEAVSTIDSQGKNNDKLIVFSMDVNGLKATNDTYGHMAGDEMIRASADGISQVMSPYGGCFRIGGDEFTAFVYGDAELAEFLQKELDRVLSEWSGKLVKSVSVSCGYATLEEFPDSDINKLIRLADLRMYRAKSRYYQHKGVDRRLQQVAYNAMCDSYTKILKINLTDDSYEIIRAEAGELKRVKGYAGTVSDWMSGFARSQQVHPDDTERYMRFTSLDYMREYFRSGRKNYTLYYRRRISDKFTRVMMELIPAPDYTDDNQTVFLYVKDIGASDFE